MVKLVSTNFVIITFPWLNIMNVTIKACHINNALIKMIVKYKTSMYWYQLSSWNEKVYGIKSLLSTKPKWIIE